MTFRNNKSGPTRVLSPGENHAEICLNAQEERHAPLLETLFSGSNFLNSSNTHANDHPTNAMRNQPKFPEYIHQSNTPQGGSSSPQANIFGQNEVKSSTDNGMLSSALMENLTALAKLDQLTSEQQPPLIDLQHMYQNIGANSGGDTKVTRHGSQELFQRPMNTSSNQLGENFPCCYSTKKGPS